MIKFIAVNIILLLTVLSIGCVDKAEKTNTQRVDVVTNEDKQVVDILVSGKLFTSYLYTDKISNLKKPVLFPVIASNGAIITRGYPLQTRPGERIDHPHHIGLWLNYGEVNGLDFWGYSDATPPEQAHRMGVIRHRQIKRAEGGAESGVLDVTMDWLKPDGTVILEESTRFIFRASEHTRIIDRLTTLTAVNESVLFNDTKEGMFAIRVNRALEHPSDKPIILSDIHGNTTDVPVLDNTGVTGHYLSSSGVEGMDVWGKRAKWVALSGEINKEKVSVVIFDHPTNVGYPMYWHARGYGLFAANPLGQKVFSKGKESMNLTLQPGESVTFTYRTLILAQEANAGKIEKEYVKFIEDMN
jgi:hypothetical protein